MKKQICSLTSQYAVRQENFWKWIDQEVRSLVTSLAEKVLQLQMQTHLRAGSPPVVADLSGHL